MLRLIFLLAALVAVFAGDVVTGTPENFDSVIADNEHVFVKFYAPWCGHCKKLAPEFEKAATDLAGEIVLMEVDCPEHQDICSKFGVRGYPTLKLFSNEKASDYEGPRDHTGIVKHLRKRLQPAMIEADSVTEEMKEGALLVVYEGSEHKSAFSSFADLNRDDFDFVYVSGDAETVTIYTHFDGAATEYEGEISDSSAFKKFLNDNSFPLVGEIGPDNYKKYVDRGLPLVWIAVDPSTDEKDSAIEACTTAAADNRDLSFVWVNRIQFKSHIENLGLSGNGVGLVIAVGQAKYLYEEEFTADAVSAFFSDYAAGNVSPFLKSEPIPESNDEPVFVVVGKNFQEAVVDNDKDVLLEFYAPWCGHCKKLAPEWEKVGEAYANNDNVVIAKIDATANDAEGIEVTGFPTIYFFKSGEKDSPVRYNGDRTAEGIVEWLEENGVHASVHDEL